MNDINKSKSYGFWYIVLFCILILTGTLSWHYINSIDYSKEGRKTIKAENFSQEDLEGYVVYLDFWASWCLPCRQSFPWMQTMRETYADKGLRIVAVNLDESSEEMENFLSEYSTDFSIIADPSYSLFQKYRILGIPTSILFNRQGEEVSRHQGFRLEQQDFYQQGIEEEINKINE